MVVGDGSSNGELVLLTFRRYCRLALTPYRILSLQVIPGAALSRKMFTKIGAAGSCVLGNFFTGCLIIILLFLGTASPTQGTFIGFVIVLYIGFPMTVLSQLSTGPMLDMIAPPSKRGFVQGFNVSVMNAANAVTPFIFGAVADSAGITVALWISIGVSFCACLVNAPLMFFKELKNKDKDKPKESIKQVSEEELEEQVMSGKLISAEDLNRINSKRWHEGKPFLVLPCQSFELDKPMLAELYKQAQEDFKFVKHNTDVALSEQLDTPEKREALLKHFNEVRPSPEQREKTLQDLGNWFTDYLKDCGYSVDESPLMYKQMLMKAFPTINKDGENALAEDNIEEVMLAKARVVNGYIDDEPTPSYRKIFPARFGF